MEFKRIAFKMQGAVDSDGYFTGIANAFNVKDLGGDIVLPGAFAKTLADWKASGNALPLLWNHDYADVRGKWVELEERETDLWGRAQVNLKTTSGSDAAALMNQGAVDGLSIGYEIAPGGAKYDTDQKAWLLGELKLWEISIATFPMNQASRIDRVKSLLQRGESATVRDIEKALRELGFSQRDAKRVAGRVEGGAAGMAASSEALAVAGMAADDDDAADRIEGRLRALDLQRQLLRAWR